MSVESEIHMLRTGLRNRDFRPGTERDDAQRRLAHLLALVDGPDRPRGRIALTPQR